MRGVWLKMTDRGIYKFGIRELALCSMGVFLLALMIRNSDVAITYVREGLSICARALIPSLFPFMVISDLFIKSGGADLLGRLLGAPMRALFGVSGAGAVAVVIGALCGFPIGARCAVSLLDSGRISHDECERLIAISSNPSSAFLISAVGVSLFGSRAFGRALYAATLASSAVVGIVLGVISRRKKPSSNALRGISFEVPKKHRFCAGDVSDAIASSAEAMLKVCAFVVFFTAFTGVLCEMLSACALPQSIKAAICAFFELTGGVAEAAKVKPAATGGIIAALAAGWSGVSVYLQISGICRGREISLLPYVISKLATGALAALMISVYLRIAPPTFYADTPTVLIEPRGAWITCAVFAAACLFYIINIIKRRERNE